MTDATEPTVVTQALKPCPFCGAQAQFVEDNGDFDRPFGLVIKHAESCFMTGCMMADWETIIVAWNTRAAEQSRASTPAVGWEAIKAAIREHHYTVTKRNKENDGVRVVHRGLNEAADAILALHPPASDDAIAAKDAEIDLAAIDAVIAEMIEVAVNDGEGDAAEVDFDRGDVDRWQASLQRASGHKNGFPSRAARGCAVHGGNKVPGQCDLATCTYPFCERQP